jgi:DNA-binding IclR family transcriptional regulator
MLKKYYSSTIQRALNILNLFEDYNKLSFTQIQNILKFNKSTLFRVLQNLENNNYLSLGKHGRYELGLKIFILGNRISSANKLIKVASPYLKNFSDRIKLTVHIGILDGLNVVIIDKYEPPNTIKMVSHIGGIVPAHCTGQGKVLLAYSSEEKVKRIIKDHGLKKYTSNTITTTEGLFNEINKIRKYGYAIDNSEHEKRIRCIAVPIINESNELEAAISITALSMDFNSRKHNNKRKSFN